MKKICYLFTAALAIIAVASCQESELDPELVPETSVKTFTVSLADTQTKTSLTIDEGTSSAKVSWEADDQISIFDGTSNVTVTLTADNIDASDASVATFTASVVEAETYYAIYPANSATTFADAVINTCSQSGEFADVAAMAAVSTDGTSFSFKNIFGLVQFSTERTDVNSIKFEGASGEAIAASDFALAFDASGSVSTTGTTTATSLVISVNNLAGTYYIALPSVSLSSGFNMTLYSDTDAVLGEVKAGNALNLSVGHIIRLGSIDSHVAHYIYDADDLQQFITDAPDAVAGETWRFANDIDLDGVTLGSATTFAGTLDGQGYSIKNWDCTAPMITLAGTSSSATAIVKNIVIDNTCTITPAHGYFGTLVGRLYGTAENCINYAAATITDTDYAQYMFGTLIGRNEGLISGCKNYGNVTFAISNETSETSATSYYGGICGIAANPQTGERFVNCVNEGNVSVSISGSVNSDGESRIGHQYIGGICGSSAVNAGRSSTTSGYTKNYGVISSCTNSGAISLNRPDGGSGSYAQLGGIIGYAEMSINNCTNTGSVTYISSTSVGNAKPSVGGIAGSLAISASNCTNSGDVSMTGFFGNGSAAYVSTAMGITYASVGGCFGVLGQDADSTTGVYNCDNSGKVTATTYNNAGNGSSNTAGGIIGSSGASSVPVDGCDNTGAIIATMQSKTAHIGGICGYSKSAISNCTNSGSCTLTHDIDELSSPRDAILNVGGIVGYNAMTVSGCSNLAGANVTASGSQARVGGVVGMSGAGDADISSSHNYADVSFTKTYNSSKEYYFGGVVGLINIATATITDCSNAGAVSSVGTDSTSIYTGGVVGMHKGPSATNCSNSGTITIDGGGCTKGVIYAAGVIGTNYSSTTITLTNCSNSGNIVNTNSATTGWTWLGGVYGHYSSQPKLASCTNTGNITSDAASKVRVGGLTAGSGSTITNCSNNCTVTVKNASTGSMIGSAIGYFNGTSLSGCDFRGTLVTESTDSGAYVGGVIGSNGSYTSATRTWDNFYVDVQVTTDHSSPGYFIGYVNSSYYCLGSTDSPVQFSKTCSVNGTAIPTSPTADDLVGKVVSTDYTLTLTNVEVVDQKE